MASLSNTVTPCSPLQVVSLQGSGKCMAEYIWIGSSGADLKSRTIVLDEKPSSPDDLPIAEIDGSSYGQAAAEQCEIYLQPRKIFPDPFRGGDHILVLCDTYVPPMACNSTHDWDDLQPHLSNHRAACETVMQQAAYQQPVFSMQQEYSIYSGGETFPGFPSAGFGLGSAPLPIKGVPSGLSSKASVRLGRDVSELHMQACLSAGISYSGSHNSSSHQWAYKIGPCGGVDMADQLCMSRFLLSRVAEHSGAEVIYNSADGKQPGGPHSCKCIISFSTATSRDPISGLSEVQCMMERLQFNHVQHLLCYTAKPAANKISGSWQSARDAFGIGNSNDAPAYHSDSGTATTSNFTVGVGNKHASIMVPTSTLINQCGPILDRRPPANADPYLAIMLLVASACGVPLPTPQLNVVQLAGALAAATGSSPCGCSSSAAVPIPAGGSCLALSSHGTGSMGPSCSYGSSMLSGSANSQDVLLSALDRLDRLDGCRGSASRKRSSCYCNDDVSEICSDASSPPIVPLGLAAAVDEDMFYE